MGDVFLELAGWHCGESHVYLLGGKRFSDSGLRGDCGLVRYFYVPSNTRLTSDGHVVSYLCAT